VVRVTARGRRCALEVAARGGRCHLTCGSSRHLTYASICGVERPACWNTITPRQRCVSLVTPQLP